MLQRKASLCISVIAGGLTQYAIAERRARREVQFVEN
jgi:hypothetical protein